MRFSFVSGHTFGAAYLGGLLDAGCTPVKLYSLHPRYAPSTAGYFDLCSRYSRAFHEARYIQPREDVSGAFEDVDYTFVVGFSYLIPSGLLTGPSTPIGAHPTLLPIGRGRAPIPWTILYGLTVTGLSTFLLTAEADAGPLMHQTSFAIAPYETATSLFRRFVHEHRMHGAYVGARLCRGGITPVAQPEKGVDWDKRTPTDAHVTFNQTASNIERLIRAAQPPYQRAFITALGETIHVRRAKLKHDSAPYATLPGDILLNRGKKITVATNDLLIGLQLDGQLPKIIRRLP